MLNRILVAAAVTLAMVAMSAFAVDLSQVETSIPLKDGAVVYIFKDGKMGMEDKNARPARMQPNVVMEGKDGQRYIMIGDEVARVDSLMSKVKRPK